MSPVQNSGSSDPLLAAMNGFETRLLRYAFSICRDEELAEDAVQGTFLRLAREYRRRLDLRKLGRSLFTVCRNRSVDLTRAGRRIFALNPAAHAETLDETPCSDAAALLRDEAALMLGAVDELPEPQRMRRIGPSTRAEALPSWRSSSSADTGGWSPRPGRRTWREARLHSRRD